MHFTSLRRCTNHHSLHRLVLSSSRKQISIISRRTFTTHSPKQTFTKEPQQPKRELRSFATTKPYYNEAIRFADEDKVVESLNCLDNILRDAPEAKAFVIAVMKRLIKSGELTPKKYELILNASHRFGLLGNNMLTIRLIIVSYRFHVSICSKFITTLMELLEVNDDLKSNVLFPALTCFAQGDRPLQTIFLYDSIKKQTELNAIDYLALLNYCTISHNQFAKRLIEDSDSISFTLDQKKSIIRSLLRLQLFNEAVTVYRTLTAEELESSLDITRSLLNTFTNANLTNNEIVTRLLEHIQQYRVKSEDLYLMILNLIKISSLEWSAAQYWINNYIESGTVSNEKNLYHVIKLLVSMGKMSEAFKTINQMQQYNIVSRRTVSALLKGLKFDEGFELIQTMKSKYGADPIIFEYGIVMNTCETKEQLDILLNLMQQNHIEPNIITMNTHLKILCRLKLRDEALQFYRQMKDKAPSDDLAANSTSLSTVVSAFSSEPNFVDSLFQDFLEIGQKESIAFCQFVTYSRKAREWLMSQLDQDESTIRTIHHSHPTLFQALIKALKQEDLEAVSKVKRRLFECRIIIS
jgi:hypothetical protein